MQLIYLQGSSWKLGQRPSRPFGFALTTAGLLGRPV